MMKALLVRGKTTWQGTPGRLYLNDRPFAFTLELPWRDNKSDISCIPVGSYTCRVHASPKFGKVYEVCDVEGRSNVLIHAGNWAGAKDKGYKTNVEGCLLIGPALGKDGKGQLKLLPPTLAMVNKLMHTLKGEPFYLEIVGVENWDKVE